LGENGNEIHKKNWADKYHEIFVEKESKFYLIVKNESGIVNSAHHQAINKLGENLKAVAFTNDGIIEAIELINNESQFLIAVQWHPERMENPKSVFSMKVRKAFLESIIQKKQNSTEKK
jgi:putative glutamine amidotransferase